MGLATDAVLREHVRSFILFATPPLLFLADFDLDGKPDLIYNGVYLIRNTSN